ncbi:MAG: recombinase [Nitriliruptorales bacterium]|nr:recombinase [Nitriliruptorales bacterium]
MTAPATPDPASPEQQGDDLASNPIWQQDNVTLHSVGVDVGSSGTQVIFSRLHLQRIGEELTSRYVVVDRTTLFQSPVWLTPYLDDDRIDAVRLGAMVDEAYRAAGQHPERVDTGVVILTGEALRRRNAQRIASTLAELSGDLVCASAGHNMEALLSAYGSGAARLSHDRAARVLNVDIGGGTTKYAIVDHGRIVATAALHVGGRLVVVDEDGRISRLEPAGREHAERVGLAWELGSTVTDHELDRVADTMAQAVVDAVVEPQREDLRALHLTEPLADLGHLDGVMFSGGVAEYVYDLQSEDFGDLGRRLGVAVRTRADADALPAPLLPPGERIRATVLGASQYSVQLSGSTSHISDADTLLPRRNLQVLRPAYALDGTVDPDTIAAAIRRHLVVFDAHDPRADLALALPWEGAPSYRRVLALARGIADGLSERIAHRRPVYLLLDGDIALTLGMLLRDELGVDSPLIVLDGLLLRDFDYIDLGRVRLPSNTVPVTIKSLVFAV